MSFLFAWARMSVIQTGSIAFLGFFLGDYLSLLCPLGAYSSAVYAIITIIVLTAINIRGIVLGKWVQNLFTLAIVAGLVTVIGIGIFGTPSPVAVAVRAPQSLPGLGLMMVFVLLAYGGWNESAYVSAEIKDPAKNIVRSLIIGLSVVILIYLLVNWSYLRILGLEGMAQSRNIAAGPRADRCGAPVCSHHHLLHRLRRAEHHERNHHLGSEEQLRPGQGLQDIRVSR